MSDRKVERGEMAGLSASSATSSWSSYPGVYIPPWWEETADAIAYESATWPPPIALICGPGNSGKSTFSRLLLSTLLQRYKKVGYLDTDLGQPEFTPPGCLSFHVIDSMTPDLSILCLKTPERCFFYGDVASKRDPEAYLNNIFSLYDHFIKEYHQSSELDNPGKPMLPLIVNTSGWVKGVGYDLLVRMLRYMSPSHVVQIRISAESKNLPTGMFWLDGNQKEPVNLIEIHAAHKDSINRPVFIQKDARIMRDLRMIAYFRQCLPRELGISTYRELAHSLASIPPFKVPLSRIKVMRLHCQVSRREVFHSLNGTIVGLAVSSWVPSSSECCIPWCVGLGFVRAVDISKEELYLITPVPRCSLEKVDLLLQGFIELPTCLLQVSPCMSTNALHKLEPPELDVQVARSEKAVFRTPVNLARAISQP